MTHPFLRSALTALAAIPPLAAPLEAGAGEMAIQVAARVIASCRLQGGTSPLAEVRCTGDAVIEAALREARTGAAIAVDTSRQVVRQAGQAARATATRTLLRARDEDAASRSIVMTVLY